MMSGGPRPQTVAAVETAASVELLQARYASLVPGPVPTAVVTPTSWDLRHWRSRLAECLFARPGPAAFGDITSR